MNKVAVVTGGASGIGQAVVERLVRDDFTVVILDINEEGGNQFAAEIQGRGKQVTFVQLDVTREADVKKTFQRSFRITAALMSSSMSPVAACIDIKSKNFRWTIGKQSSTLI
jgi:NAD(P)-dependent dehydrogenase (short-subunit alcohol dehydrogenase family)